MTIYAILLIWSIPRNKMAFFPLHMDMLSTKSGNRVRISSNFHNSSLESTCQLKLTLGAETLLKHLVGGCPNSTNRKKYTIDLFAVQNRCGRWAAQTSMIHSMLGVQSLVLYNCTLLIELWMTRPRELRNDKALHRYILKACAPDLCKYDYAQDKQTGVKKLLRNLPWQITSVLRFIKNNYEFISHLGC